MTSLIRRVLLGLGLIAAVSVAASESRIAHPADVAFYYGDDPPVAELRHHDRVVLEPEHVAAADLQALSQSTRTLAYLSVGETPLDQPMPADWALGTNPDWDTRVMDLTRAGWRQRIQARARALAEAGYAGLFLDTLDSYQLGTGTPERAEAQRRALVTLVKTLARLNPELEIWLNRGFELLPEVHALVSGVVAESLFEGYFPRADEYGPVAAEDRAWLLSRLNAVRTRYGLPVVVVDYVPEGERDRARETARRIRAAGFSPYVSVASLDLLGIGLREPVPRRILLLYDGAEAPLQLTPGFEEAAPILEYLGYAVDYVDASAGGFPDFRLAGRYAGVVSWFTGPLGAGTRRWERWLHNRVVGRVPLVLLGDPSIESPSLWRELGMAPTVGRPPRDIAIVERGPLGGGYEAEPRARRLGLAPWHSVVESNRVQVGLGGGDTRWDPVVLGPWGGLAAAPYLLEAAGSEGRTRWQFDPFRFFDEALGGPDFPVPDPTTENGLRVLTAHIDGDAFPSRAALPGTPYAADVIRRRILDRHRFPHTVSIVEGEIGPAGLYPEQSPALEGVARAIFRLPHVEAGSHSFSHPFDWSAAAREGTSAPGVPEDRPEYGEVLKYGVHLPIPGYEYNLEREIAGSRDYIERELLPPGKRVQVFQWTGDAWPGPEAVSAAYEAGLGNINGGNSVMTEAFPSVTGLSPMIRPTAGGPQFLAPLMNENVYTNGWQGPYYGYRRVVEAFRLTGAPRRLRPVSLYYHFYSGTNPAGLKALEAAYDYAESRPLIPLWISEYVSRVRGFYDATLSRSLDGGAWQVRDLHGLRTLRLPDSIAMPSVLPGTGVAGGRQESVGRYASLAEDRATLVNGDGAGPGIFSADAPLAFWRVVDSETVEVGFRTLGRVNLVMGRPQCRLLTGEEVVKGRTVRGHTEITLTDGTGDRARIVCP